MLRVGRLSIGTLHPTIYPTCSRSQEHRATITMDIAMSSKNVERYDIILFKKLNRCNVRVILFQVDPSGPLATLRKLLLSDESLATFRRWIIDHWYAAALIILAAISLLVSVRFL